MKNKKWLSYTLGILLTLIVLVAVGAAGFRIGAMQNNTFAHPMMNGAGPNFERGFGNGQMPNFHPQGFEGRDFHGRGFDRGERMERGGFFPPIFGLIKLAVLAALLWFGFKLIKNSGWKLTREAASVPAPAPVVSEAPAAEVDEKKE
jgi:hypothetical protein